MAARAEDGDPAMIFGNKKVVNPAFAAVFGSALRETADVFSFKDKEGKIDAKMHPSLIELTP